jgi:hypothetical protein
LKGGSAFLYGGHGTVATKQRGHVDGKTGIPDPAGEARDMGADARHFGHHDHCRTFARDPHFLADAIEGGNTRTEVLQGIVYLQIVP